MKGTILAYCKATSGNLSAANGQISKKDPIRTSGLLTGIKSLSSARNKKYPVNP
jgi:hypothetical protein